MKLDTMAAYGDPRITPGTQVVTNFDDPGFPSGTRGIARAVHDDPGDGVDVEFPSGTYNVMHHGLDIADSATEK